jgi:hypothetical protein
VKVDPIRPLSGDNFSAGKPGVAGVDASADGCAAAELPTVGRADGGVVGADMEFAGVPLDWPQALKARVRAKIVVAVRRNI